MSKLESKAPSKAVDPAHSLLDFIRREERTLRRIADRMQQAERLQLRRIRQGLCLDQAEVARACGMSQQGLSHTEMRENAETISIGKLRRVARAMGFEVAYFLLPMKERKGPS